MREAEINSPIPTSSGKGSSPQGHGALLAHGKGDERALGHRSACPRETVRRGHSKGEEATAAQLGGEGENKTGAGESPDLSSSDPQGLGVNGDS